MPVDRELQALLRQVADEAARKAVDDALTRIGVDLDDPFELQADMRHLRRWRQNMETVERKGVLTGISLGIVGLCVFVYVAITQSMWIGK